MAKYQVEVPDTFYYYILVDAENEKVANIGPYISGLGVGKSMRQSATPLA